MLHCADQASQHTNPETHVSPPVPNLLHPPGVGRSAASEVANNTCQPELQSTECNQGHPTKSHWIHLRVKRVLPCAEHVHLLHHLRNVIAEGAEHDGEVTPLQVHSVWTCKGRAGLQASASLVPIKWLSMTSAAGHAAWQHQPHPHPIATLPLNVLVRFGEAQHSRAAWRALAGPQKTAVISACVRHARRVSSTRWLELQSSLCKKMKAAPEEGAGCTGADVHTTMQRQDVVCMTAAPSGRAGSRGKQAALQGWWGLACNCRCLSSLQS